MEAITLKGLNESQVYKNNTTHIPELIRRQLQLFLTLIPETCT